MRVLNVIWGFTLGAGIDKCFLTYSRLGEVEKSVEMKNICINVLSRNSHIEPLKELGVTFIDIKNPLDFSWVNRLKQQIDAFNPDVFFSHGFNGAIMSLIERWCKRMKTKIVLTYHGEYYAPTAYKKILEPIYNHLNYYIFNYIAGKVIAVSDYSRQYLVGKGVFSKKIVVVHNGIKDLPSDWRCSLMSINKKDIVNILSVSRIDKVKGLEFLLEALSKIKQNGVAFHYYMIGDGPELDNLKHLCKCLNLENEITFLGFIDNVTEWLGNTDIFTITSHFENHSIAILEAMRAGKAIVATNVGGNGESIRNMEEGLLVPPANPEELADALEKMIKDEKLRQRLSENARKRFLEEFTEETMMKNIVKVLQS